MQKTKIEWADYSWPIVNGCRRKSAGCENCYAERLAATRLVQTPKYRGLATMTAKGPRWTGETRLWEPELTAPLRIKKRSRIFVADMGDLFYEGVSDSVIWQVFNVMRQAHWHQFQVLTKRAERLPKWFEFIKETVGLGQIPWPLPNVWLGVSVEDQKTADERIPLLLQTPAALRFVSYEPALGPVDFTEIALPGEYNLSRVSDFPSYINSLISYDDSEHFHNMHAGLDWVIVGGESGPRARPFCTDWALSTIHQTGEADVKCFVKQLGARPYEKVYDPHSKQYFDERIELKDKKGGTMSEWPPELRVREMPPLHLVGSKSS